MISGLLESVSLIERIEPSLDHCEVTLNDFSTYTIFDSYEDLLKLVGEEVEFSVRKDVVHGIVKDVINLTNKTNLLYSIKDDVDSTKSLIDANSIEEHNICKFDSKSLKINDITYGENIMVFDVVEGKSKIATWYDLKCLDCNSISFNLRMFYRNNDYKDFISNCIGSYIVVDIKNTQYGFQVLEGSTVAINSVEDVKFPREVHIAYSALSKLIENDKELKSYVIKYSFLDKLKNLMYVQPGYRLVELYAEILLINSFNKIFSLYDKKVLVRASFASRGYLCIKNKSVSNVLTNYHLLLLSDLKNDNELISILDINKQIEDGNHNKAAYFLIKKVIKQIMKDRRGICEYKEINNVISMLSDSYGLLEFDGDIF